MTCRTNNLERRGFTLVEIMVVVAIIGLLAAIAIPSFSKARLNAQMSRAQNDLRVLATAFEQLSMDTGQWPGGYSTDVPFPGGANEFEDLRLGIVGLMTNDGTFNARWNGPYVEKMPVDPWGSDYWFDIDYALNGENIAALGSYGPNRDGLNQYDSDNVIYSMSE
ncbi:MAG: general secretion pathway protein G [Candidatus Promineifilaceae bacterium]|jgi:general secretion pathway protein G